MTEKKQSEEQKPTSEAQELTIEMRNKKLEEIFVQLDAALEEAQKHGHGFLVVSADGKVKHVHYSVAFMTAKASMNMVV